MKTALAAYAVGLLFGGGLLVSGMTDANKVIDFLNVAGRWDPSLAFVMATAIAVHLPLYAWITGRARPLLAERFRIPTRRDINARLIGGAALFGVGWGLGGYCPGPGIVASTSGAGHALAFVGAMLVGMVLFHLAERAHQRRQHDRSPTGGVALT